MGELNGIVERVAGLAKEYGWGNLGPQIAACRRQVQNGKGVDVAVFGRFKAGKSSLLNELAGQTVLPVGVVPVTAVVTRIWHGEREAARVRFLDGRTNEISLGEVAAFGGAKENPDNLKRVAAVEVELPGLKGLAPLRFVDTPGLGSAFTHNTEVALGWLPNAGAALVAVSCDAPLSERDLALMEELRRHTPKIVLLLTKADLLSEAQRAEVLEFVRGELRRKGWGSVPVFFYSVRAEEWALREELAGRLLLPLARDGSGAAAEIARHKLRSLVQQGRGYLEIALAAATRADAARMALKAKLEEEWRHLAGMEREFGVLSREWSASALDWYLAELAATQRKLQAQVTVGLEEEMADWQLRLPPFLDAWRKWLDGYLTGALEEVSAQRREMFCAPLERAREHLTRSVRAFHDRLRQAVKESLGVELTAAEFTLEVPAPAEPPVDVAYAFDVALTTVGWLVPMTLFRGPVKRVLLRKARWEVEKNLSRLAADWRDRVAVGIWELTKRAKERAVGEWETLDGMTSREISGGPGVREALAELGRCERELNSR